MSNSLPHHHVRLRSFNRTIVELKCYHFKDQTDSKNAFNRTIVELKYRNAALSITPSLSFNRTIVELK